MGVNRIDIRENNGITTLIDISDSTITEEAMTEGAIGYGADGEKCVGTNPYKKAETDAEVDTQGDLIEQITTTLQGKTIGGSVGVGGAVEFGAFGVSGIKGYDGETPYQYPFVVGMTWEEWIATPLNMEVLTYDSIMGMISFYINKGLVCFTLPGAGIQSAVSTDGTTNGRVKPTDKIIANTTYKYSIVASGYN